MDFADQEKGFERKEITTMFQTWLSLNVEPDLKFVYPIFI